LKSGPVYVSLKDKTDKKTSQALCTTFHVRVKYYRTMQRDFIGETERSLKHASMNTGYPALHHQRSQTICTSSPLDRILDTENRWFERGVKEAIYIKANQPSLNKDGGRFKLSGVYETVIRSKVKKITT